MLRLGYVSDSINHYSCLKVQLTSYKSIYVSIILNILITSFFYFSLKLYFITGFFVVKYHFGRHSHMVEHVRGSDNLINIKGRKKIC